MASPFRCFQGKRPSLFWARKAQWTGGASASDFRLHFSRIGRVPDLSGKCQALNSPSVGHCRPLHNPNMHSNCPHGAHKKKELGCARATLRCMSREGIRAGSIPHLQVYHGQRRLTREGSKVWHI